MHFNSVSYWLQFISSFLLFYWVLDSIELSYGVTGGGIRQAFPQLKRIASSHKRIQSKVLSRFGRILWIDKSFSRYKIMLLDCRVDPLCFHWRKKLLIIKTITLQSFRYFFIILQGQIEYQNATVTIIFTYEMAISI